MQPTTIVPLAAGQVSDLNLTLVGLNHAVVTLQHALAQLNLTYAAGVVAGRLNEVTAGDPASLAAWLTSVSGQIVAEASLSRREAEQAVYLALCRLAGYDDDPADPLFDPTVTVGLVLKAQREANEAIHRRLADLDGFFLGDVAGEERCVHLTLADEATLVIDIFDRKAAANTDDEGNLVGAPIIINLETGAICTERQEDAHS